LLDAKSITEANLPGIEDEQNKPGDERFMASAVDYVKTAAELSEKYKIKVYAGKTGLLSAEDIRGDEYLGSLYLTGGGLASTSLVRIVFAVEQLKTSELGPFDARQPRLYENIGPLKDMRMRELTDGFSGKNMMLVRVVKTEKAAEPGDLNEKVNKQAIRFDEQGAAGKDANSIRELVVEDLKLLGGMDKAGEKAGEFLKLAIKDGWTSALDKFNELYGELFKKDKNATGKQQFALKNQSGIRRISEIEVQNLAVRYSGEPTARYLLNRGRVEKLFIDKLYSLVSQDSNAFSASDVIIEFKPYRSYYCLKSLVRHPLYQEQFDRVKTMDTIGEEFGESQMLAVVHYHPDGILKRMNFSMVQEEQRVPQSRSVEGNTPSAPVNQN
jgi:hypothetical protein